MAARSLEQISKMQSKYVEALRLHTSAFSTLYLPNAFGGAVRRESSRFKHNCHRSRMINRRFTLLLTQYYLHCMQQVNMSLHRREKTTVAATEDDTVPFPPHLSPLGWGLCGSPFYL
jgi:hypothetical protein